MAGKTIPGLFTYQLWVLVPQGRVIEEEESKKEICVPNQFSGNPRVAKVTKLHKSL